MSDSLDQQIKESAQNYRPDPNLSWENVEGRLDRKNKSKVKRLYTLITIAASFVLLIGAFAVNQWISSTDHQNSLFVSADSITELEHRTSYNYHIGSYPVHDLYRAYDQADLIQEGGSSLNGWR